MAFLCGGAGLGVSAWRLIVDGSLDGARNMAVDAAMLEARASGDAPATLRLYRWSRPTVSLGRFQDLRDVDGAAARDAGVDVVRRPTGGRGVLHDDELTYSVIANSSDGIPQGVVASYRFFCAALVEAYRALGVPAQLTARPRGDRRSGACYLHATHADLSLGAAKLSGSAQVWKDGVCLQHGSFVRSRDIDVEARLFRLEVAAAERLACESVTLSDALEASPSFEEIGAAVVGAFERVLGIDLVQGSLTAEEDALASRLTDTFMVASG